jgi:UDP-N-acetylglucosamine diphosphorylase / glucose-1-phosphate thymidylyltransferase / UDP-N-acetylgalactosamine diphosphorylase / glucosamine-1-phosphate N-acetyltransferase / galactosamine-1-phosphate N-acetyltransferase
MQALLLAAGQSKRFQPLGDKNFFSLGDKFLIEQQVETLKKAGVKKLVIVANKDNNSRIQKLFPKSDVVVQKDLSEGMRGAVLAAKKFLDQPTLITSTNDVVDATAVKKVLTAKNCAGALLAQKVSKYFPGGYLKVGKGKIFSIIEKPKPGKEPSDLINLVFHLFHEPQKLVAELSKTSNKRDDGYERALAELFKKDKFVAVENSGTWQPVKYPWHALGLVQGFLKKQKKQISKKAQVAKTAILEGNVVVEDGAKIFDYAIVKDSIISKNAVVGSHSLVRDSLISKNAVVGSSSEVARSYLGENSWLHRNYVGDSIIKENVGLGSGAVCANLRLDEEDVKVEIGGNKISCGGNKFGCGIGRNCRIGVNTSLMPGVLIGENSFIGSGLVVENSISFQTFFTAEWKTKEVENKKSADTRAKLI